jgi:hypothetical protein
MGRMKQRRGARPGVEGLERREAPAAIAPAPQVVAVQRLGIHQQRTRIVLTFNQPMAAASTQRAGNYLLQERDGGGRFDGNPKLIRIVAATYDPAAQTVTLSTRQRLNLHREYRLTVNGNFAGLASSQGIVLDGNGDGVTGGNFVVVLRGFGPRGA